MPAPLRIDSHQHFWRYEPAGYAWIDDTMPALKRDFLPEQLKREMDAVHIDACVAVQARTTLHETDFLLNLAQQYSFIAGVVGWVDLLSPEAEVQLQTFAAHKRLCGIRHIVQSEPDGFLVRSEFLRGMKALGRFDLAYDILVYARQLPQAVTFARAFPRQRFVLDHLGKPDVRHAEYREWRRHLDDLAKLPNVCCKLSGLVTEADWKTWTPAQLRPYLDAALESFGPKRLMIGSDWPVCTLAASYSDVIGLVVEAIREYSTDEQAQVLGGTAETFYRLKV
jgi:L-fucono-1,5-lactonase